jgi:hypothetical protein
MNRKLYRWIFGVTLGVISLVFVFLIILSFDAASETENWQFLNFDFSKRNNIISAYGGLLGSILSFIAILFVILDLVYQRRQKTLEVEEKEALRIQELRDSLGLVQVFIDRLYQNNLNQSEIAIDYTKIELSEPTEMNRMTFFPNTFPKLILEVDRQNIFKALKELKPGEDWKKVYVDLYKISDFYDKSTTEITEKHQIHLNKKYKHSSEISKNLDILIDKVSNARNKIIPNYLDNKPALLQDPFFVILNDFKEKTVAVTTERKNKINAGVNPKEISSSLIEFRNEIVTPLFDGIMSLYKTYHEIPEDFEEILTLSQGFLRQTEKLMKDSTDYANHIEYYNTEYLKETSKYQIRLSEISEVLKPYA